MQIVYLNYKGEEVPEYVSLGKKKKCDFGLVKAEPDQAERFIELVHSKELVNRFGTVIWRVKEKGLIIKSRYDNKDLEDRISKGIVLYTTVRGFRSGISDGDQVSLNTVIIVNNE